MMCSIPVNALTCETASQESQCVTSVAPSVVYGLVKRSNRAGSLVKEMMKAPKVNHVTPYSTLSQFFRKGPVHTSKPGEFNTGLFDLTLSKSPDWGTSVHGSSVPSKMMGMGMGRKMYGNAIRQAYVDYVKGGDRYFFSDPEGLTSRHAQRLWNSMSRRGYPVQSGHELPLGRNSDQIMFGIDLDNMKNFYKDRVKQAGFMDNYDSWKSRYLPEPVRDGMISSVPVLGRQAQKMVDFDEKGPDFGMSRDMYINNHPLKTVSDIASPLLGYRFAPGIINKSQGLSRMADKLNVRMLGDLGSKHIPGLSRRVLGLLAGGLLGSSLSNGALSARYTQKHASQNPEDKGLDGKRQNATLAAAGASFLPSLFNLLYKGHIGGGPVSGMSDDAEVFEKLRHQADSSGAFVNTGEHIPENREGRTMLAAMHGRGPVYLPKQNVKPELFSGLLGPKHDGKYDGFINFGDQKPTSHALAHELGHHMSPKWMLSRASNISAMTAPGLGMLPVFMSDNENAGITGSALGTLGTVPQLLSELEASRRGKSMWRNAMGESSYKKLPMRSRMGTFHGLPTYMAMAAAPGIAYGTKKMLGGYDKPKQDNSLFNWSGKIPW